MSAPMQSKFDQDTGIKISYHTTDVKECLFEVIVLRLVKKTIAGFPVYDSVLVYRGLMNDSELHNFLEAAAQRGYPDLVHNAEGGK